MKGLNINKYQINSFFSVLIFNILLQFVPLASVFGYEFSVLNFVLFFFISGLIVISGVSNDSLQKKVRFILLLLIVPALISIVHTLLSVKCSITEGFLFYAVNTVPSVLFGITAGLLSKRFVPSYPKVVFFIFFFIIILIPILEFYFNPQCYFYNLFLGYFPGTIYDEALSVNSKLIIYRLINISCFGVILFLLLKRKNAEYIISVTAVTMFFVFIVLSPLIGFSTTKWMIKQKLGGRCVTEHFEIIYDKSLSKNQLNNLIMHHECYYAELSKFYHSEPGKKITSFVFKDREQKSELFGAENADIAKPWLNQIYTTADNYNTTLKHEISHVFSADIGTGFFKVASRLNPALIEGVAVASDPFYDEIFIHRLAALAYRNNYKVDLGSLYGGFSFFGNVSSLSYIYSG